MTSPAPGNGQLHPPKRPIAASKGANGCHHRAILATGEVTCTAAAAALLRQNQQFAVRFILRHLQGDFGDISPDEWIANLNALEGNAGQADLISRYRLPGGGELAVVTHYPDDWRFRWTELCLPAELVDDLAGEDEDDWWGDDEEDLMAAGPEDDWWGDEDGELEGEDES